MNISQNSIDSLNAVLTVTIEKNDYKEKVENTLKNYRKTANIKGFRKGQVPMSFIKKQYEKAVIFDEVNQLLQSGINDYIQKENLSILGNPLPKTQEDFDWDAEKLNFEFEIGLAPDFKLDLAKVKIEAYKVEVNDEEIDKYVNNFAKRFGSMKSLEKVEEGEVNIKVQVKELDGDKNEVENGLNTETFLFVEELAKPKKFIGKKVNDVVTAKMKEISEDNAKLETIFGLTQEEISDFKGLLQFTIAEITKMENSPIDSSLFDKVYGEGAVTTEEEFRQRIKEEAEKMYSRETDKQLMNDAVETLIKETKFDLPTDFLSRWLHFSNDKIESIEQAAEQLKKEEEALRYQLIEAKIAQEYDLKVEFSDVEITARQLIKDQLAMYGQSNIPEESLEKIIQGSLQNQEEFRRISEQVFSDKLLNVLKENIKVKEKKVTFDAFVEIMEEKHKHHHHDHDHDHHHHDHHHEHDHK